MTHLLELLHYLLNIQHNNPTQKIVFTNPMLAEILPKIEPKQPGISFWHGSDFLINRPAGSGDFLLLHFLTDVEIDLGDHRRIHPAGGCILYSPEQRQWYRRGQKTFGNDYIHFSGRDAARLIEELHIPTNQHFRLHETSFIRERLRDIQRASTHGTRLAGGGRALALVQLLYDIAQRLANKGEHYTQVEREHFDRILDVRDRVHQELHHGWTLDEMARLVGLSPSRYRALFRQFVGKSPIDDLLDTRLQHASRLMTEFGHSVTEAAEAAGFSSVPYFSRQFKKRYGVPPSKY